MSTTKIILVILFASLVLISACGRNITPDTLPILDSNTPPPPIAGAFVHEDDNLRGNVHPIRDMNAQTLTIAGLTRNTIPFMAMTAHNIEPDPATRHLSTIQNKRFDAGFYIADIAMLSSGLVFNFVLDARLPDNPRPIWDVIEDLRDPVQDALDEFSR